MLPKLTQVKYILIALNLGQLRMEEAYLSLKKIKQQKLYSTFSYNMKEGLAELLQYTGSCLCIYIDY